MEVQLLLEALAELIQIFIQTSMVCLRSLVLEVLHLLFVLNPLGVVAWVALQCFRALMDHLFALILKEITSSLLKYPFLLL